MTVDRRISIPRFSHACIGADMAGVGYGVKGRSNFSERREACLAHILNIIPLSVRKSRQKGYFPVPQGAPARSARPAARPPLPTSVSKRLSPIVPSAALLIVYFNFDMQIDSTVSVRFEVLPNACQPTHMEPRIMLHMACKGSKGPYMYTMLHPKPHEK
jgi:hypothetical protein